jgi:hypothetical protein
MRQFPPSEQKQLELTRKTYTWLKKLYHSGDNKLIKSYGFGDFISLETYIEFKKQQGIKLVNKIKIQEETNDN